MVFISYQKYEDGSEYDCWLRCHDYGSLPSVAGYKKFCSAIVAPAGGVVRDTAVVELTSAIKTLFSMEASVMNAVPEFPHILLGIKKSLGITSPEEASGLREGYTVRLLDEDTLAIIGDDENGMLYGVFYLLRAIGCGISIKDAQTVENSPNKLRIILHWDNSSGKIERGYAGESIFYKDDKITGDLDRVRDYARLLASVGINGIVINNTNANSAGTRFLTDDYLPDIARLADVFRRFGIKLYLSINFASPIEIGGIETADPLDRRVIDWWRDTADRVYRYIPDFGGFNVKADSENRPGPFTYGRNHVEGANMLACALRPHGGTLLWRCFVYDCHVNWRDRTTDRAKAAYDNFKPLDSMFDDNVILQIKNGPMDFQIREPISPLLGGLEKTNEVLEFQITQEYTGQQKHLCYLVPMWKEVLDFDTYSNEKKGATVAKIIDGSFFNRNSGGITGISNIGRDHFWTGHPLAQANLYGFGRLAWNPALSAEDIAEEWVKLTLGHDEKILSVVVPILLNSRKVYENYTSPLGVGWMVNPGHHYGPSVDGYEYSEWGTYHYADLNGIGVDRTQATGSGYTKQYSPEIAQQYENIETCPDNLLLFFHHVPYTHILKSGKSVMQHIYDTHFEGVESVEGMNKAWQSLDGLIDCAVFERTRERLEIQLGNAKEWRDVVNTYFYRKSGIADLKGRRIFI